MSAEKPPHNWQRMWFKGHKVWVELNEQGELKLKDKKARLKYNLEQPHE